MSLLLLRITMMFGITAVLFGTAGCINVHKAARTGDATRVAELLAKGHPVDEGKRVKAPNGDERWYATPLALAVYYRRLEVVSLLLKKGANPNGTMDGLTLLTMAVGKLEDEPTPATVELALMLVEGGADVSAKNLHGTSALHHASTAALAELLIDAGAEIDAKTEDGTTPLFLAARKAREDVVEVLLHHGADPNATLIRKKSPVGITIYMPGSGIHYDNDAELTVLEVAVGGLFMQDQRGRVQLARPSEVSEVQIRIVENLLAAGADPSPLMKNYEVLLDRGRIYSIEYHGEGDFAESWNNAASLYNSVRLVKQTAERILDKLPEEDRQSGSGELESTKELVERGIEAKASTITGIVRYANGKPCVGCKIEVWGEFDQQRSQSDENGKFSAESPSATKCVTKVAVDGYSRWKGRACQGDVIEIYVPGP